MKAISAGVTPNVQSAFTTGDTRAQETTHVSQDPTPPQVPLPLRTAIGTGSAAFLILLPGHTGAHGKCWMQDTLDLGS